ncbi:MAG TPA: FMN-binding protein [Candidatus Faecousia intestinigallinarum]|nr:FMN-binding protein [Candidatus Faecousia intestinigallinarum]
MKRRSAFIALAVIFLCGALVCAFNYGLGDMARVRRETAELELMQLLLPGGKTFTPEAYSGDDDNIRAVWKSETGYLIESGVYGYADDIVLWVGVSEAGEVTGLVVRTLHETYGLGATALYDTQFLSQYLGQTGNLEVGNGIDAITGATVTSKAITKAVNSACAYVTGADIESGATEWGTW